MEEKKESKSFLQNALIPFLSTILFFVLFAIIFLANQSSAIKSYGAGDSQALGIFSSYGLFFGLIFCAISLAGMYILYAIASVTKLTRYGFTNPIILILGYAPWLIFGIQLVFFEKKYIDLAKAIIYFEGYPMLYSSLIVVILAVALLVLSFLKKGEKSEKPKKEDKK
jgi:hypothetical protein